MDVAEGSVKRGGKNGEEKKSRKAGGFWVFEYLWAHKREKRLKNVNEVPFIGLIYVF